MSEPQGQHEVTIIFADSEPVDKGVHSGGNYPVIKYHPYGVIVQAPLGKAFIRTGDYQLISGFV